MILYKYTFIFFIILFYYNNIYVVKGEENIVLNVLAYSESETDNNYVGSVDDFNEYAEKNNINIRLNINVHANQNSFEAFANSVETLLKKKLNRYDLYYFDNGYTVRYGPYLLDLKEYTKDIIGMHDQKIVDFTCRYDDKLVGIPVSAGYSALYSNKILLGKYGLPIPKTWDELKKTAKYIMEQENDPTLVAYNGLLDESENGICSIYEFIYSFRDSIDDPFPEIRSKTTINALNYLKEMKEEFGLDEVFKKDMSISLGLLFQKKAIFTKLYTLPSYFVNSIPYSVSPLPGYKEGVSTGILTGYNIGVDGNIPKEKIQAAITAIKFLTSKDTQKKYFMMQNVITSIPSLYDDNELCQMVDCEFFKNIQFTVRPTSKYYGYTDLYLRIERNIYDYLYGDEKVENVVKNVEDLTKIHYVSFKEKESHNELALGIFILVVTLSFLMIGSLVFLFSGKLNEFFNYLSVDSWIISIFGLIVLISSCYTTLGPVTDAKCHLYIVLTVLGYTLNLTPVIHKLVVDFPDEIKLLKWIKDHKYVFFVLFILFDVIVLSLFSLKVFDVKVNIIEDGENFETCKIKNTLSLILLLFILIVYLMVICTSLLLCYVEWGVKTVIYDIRIYILAFYTDAFCVVLYFIFEFLSVKNYIIQFLIKNALTLIPVITNYITMYGFRFYLPFYKTDENEISATSIHVKKDTYSKSINSESNQSFIMKMRNYHNQTISESKRKKFISGYSIEATSKGANFTGTGMSGSMDATSRQIGTSTKNSNA